MTLRHKRMPPHPPEPSCDARRWEQRHALWRTLEDAALATAGTPALVGRCLISSSPPGGLAQWYIR
eukprot:CAMPEP_0203919630 /NCGR_PEP_ID=MMETSP0359-20131031/60010_1 /ASSEMBLY_ACC=CAM_ASM_000338 /TAXON_ID=268821 /ORGANISM="Scrippsiella Hangoei, Strain SHTV-5" /LENGTH=65 /DNA_ID=CAMNT_0050846963 /DNA_START=11 /DNA_END=205 /DNA_ORIENTATION=+